MTWLRWMIVAALAVTGCGTGSGTSLGSGGGSGSSSSSSSGSGQMGTPLPCDLTLLLEDRCHRCHGEEPKYDATRSLVTHEDLTGSGDGYDTLAEASLARMELLPNDEGRMPFPPETPATADEIAIMRGFVNSGFPEGEEGQSCE